MAETWPEGKGREGVPASRWVIKGEKREKRDGGREGDA